MALKHRFNEEHLQEAWGFQNHCFYCGENGWDAVHHIISSSSNAYQNLKCNASVLNSCPIHNHKCHLYNSDLHRPETEKLLLKKVLMVLSANGYKFKPIDRQFISAYQEYYETDNTNH